MQRVLSFPPPSRGFGDPTEFVSKRMCFSFMFSLGFIAFLGGFLLGRFVFDKELELSRNKLKKANLHHQEIFGIYKNYSQFNFTGVIDGISASAIEQHLALLQNESSNDSDTTIMRKAEILRDHLSSNGFSLVSPLVKYQLHLSYPSSQYPNQAFILDDKNDIILQCNDTRQRHSGPSDAFRTTIIEGNVVYVNFGRNEDYHHLDSSGITVSGNLVLVRAGKVLPTEIVNNALDHEARGILVYLDPEQKDVKLPLLSPGDLAKLQILHGNQIDKWSGSLPILEISSDDAEKIFIKMSTTELSSESWRGKLKCTYPIGPGFINANWKMKMEVNTVNIVKNYINVLGAMRGSQEPDRFVMLANEKSLVNIEQESTSIILEVVRVLGNLKKKGWRPHRSIVVAFWGVEGSNQHLSPYPESLISKLRENTVAYLKTDSSNREENEETQAIITPALEKLYRKSSKAAFLNSVPVDLMLPNMSEDLFIQSGIPFIIIENFKSSGNESLKKMTSFLSVTVWNVAESHGLPFSLDAYSKFFTHTLEVIEKRFKIIAQKHTLFLDTLFQSVQLLIDVIKDFESKWSHADKSKSVEMRIMNDQLLTFVHSLSCDRDQSLTNIFSSRHLIFSKSITGNDDKAGFGELQDLLREITSTRAPDNLHQHIITHLANLVECINLSRYTLIDSLETFITGKT